MRIIINDNGKHNRLFHVKGTQIKGEFIKVKLDYMIFIDGEKYTCRGLRATLDRIELHTRIKLSKFNIKWDVKN